MLLMGSMREIEWRSRSLWGRGGEYDKSLWIDGNEWMDCGLRVEKRIIFGVDYRYVIKI